MFSMEINQNKDESPAFPPKESKFMKSKYKIDKENNGSLKDSPVVLLVVSCQASLMNLCSSNSVSPS